MTDTFLTDDSLDVLRGIIGAQLRSYGTDLELDDGVGAFGAWLDTDRGTVELEFVEQVWFNRNEVHHCWKGYMVRGTEMC